MSSRAGAGVTFLGTGAGVKKGTPITSDPYLMRERFFKIQSIPNRVLNWRILLNCDPGTGSCSTLACTSVEQIGEFCNLSPVQNFH